MDHDLAPPDLALGHRFLLAHPPPGRALLLAVTGSHHYGFSSADSDLDLKGVHLAPTRSMLGLGHPREAFDRLKVFEGTECDLTTHEAGMALSLLLKGNGNVLERIFSPYQVLPGPRVEELRALARQSLSRACYGHYAGYFRGMQREHLRDVAPRAKSLLYTLRVALTGVHLLRTGEVQGHLPTLAELYDLPDVFELIEIKRNGVEKGALSPAAAEHYRALWPRLEAMLEEAKAGSPLPVESEGRAACETWLVEARLAELRGEA